MRKYFLPLSVFLAMIPMLAGCSADKISYTDEPISGGGSSETAADLDCTDFNADIAVLQILTGELLSGSCVMSVQDQTLAFDSGTLVSVVVREDYGFGYTNPSVGVSGRFWVAGGTVLEMKVADALLQFKCEDGAWSYCLDGGLIWNYCADAEAGTGTPVFKSLEDNGETVVVSLGSGNTFSFDYYEKD